MGVKNSDICPKCGKFRFTQEYLDKNSIGAQDELDCPVCGAMLYYSIACRIQKGGDEEYIMVFEESTWGVT